MKKVYLILTWAVLCLCLLLSGCSLAETLFGKEESGSDIVGTWFTAIDISAPLTQHLGELYGLDEASYPRDADLEIYTVLEFREDGTYSFSCDAEATAHSLEDYLAVWVGGEYGSAISAGLMLYNPVSLTDEMSMKEGYYRYEDGRLYLADSEDALEDTETWLEVELSDDELSIREAHGGATELCDWLVLDEKGCSLTLGQWVGLESEYPLVYELD